MLEIISAFNVLISPFHLPTIAPDRIPRRFWFKGIPSTPVATALLEFAVVERSCSLCRRMLDRRGIPQLALLISLLRRPPYLSTNILARLWPSYRMPTEIYCYKIVPSGYPCFFLCARGSSPVMLSGDSARTAAGPGGSQNVFILMPSRSARVRLGRWSKLVEGPAIDGTDELA